MKAYIHQGKAHLGLKQFDKAIESFETAMKIEPKKTSVIKSEQEMFKSVQFVG